MRRCCVRAECWAPIARGLVCIRRCPGTRPTFVTEQEVILEIDTQASMCDADREGTAEGLARLMDRSLRHLRLLVACR